jgi:hypothetical protein
MNQIMRHGAHGTDQPVWDTGSVRLRKRRPGESLPCSTPSGARPPRGSSRSPPDDQIRWRERTCSTRKSRPARETMDHRFLLARTTTGQCVGASDSLSTAKRMGGTRSAKEPLARMSNTRQVVWTSVLPLPEAGKAGTQKAIFERLVFVL